MSGSVSSYTYTEDGVQRKIAMTGSYPACFSIFSQRTFLCGVRLQYFMRHMWEVNVELFLLALEHQLAFCF